MNILQISTPFLPVMKELHYGGTERVVYALDRVLLQRGHKTAVAAPATSKPSGKLLPTVATHIYALDGKGGDVQPRIPFHGGYAALYLRIEHLWKSLSYGNGGFDVVHVHDTNFLPFMSLLTAPNLITLHEACDETFWNTSLQPSLTELPIQYVAISEDQQRRYQSCGFPVQHVIHHGIDIQNITFSPEGRNYLLCLGRVNAMKGQSIAISVAQRVGKNIIIAGNIEDQAYFDTSLQPCITDDLSMKACTDKYNTYLTQVPQDGTRVVYVGEVNETQKDPLFAHAQASLMPTQWDEPFGLVSIESLARGTPVITFNRGALPEIVEHGKSGFVVSSIEEMVESVGAIPSISREACRKRAEDHFSLEAMTKKYEQLYERLRHSQ